MKNKFLFGLIFVLVGLTICGVNTNNASAYLTEQVDGQLTRHQQAALTPIPTSSPSIIGEKTPESRVLPPIGSNAGLVIGASVLVLIIIGGVLGARRRQNH